MGDHLTRQEDIALAAGEWPWDIREPWERESRMDLESLRRKAREAVAAHQKRIQEARCPF